MSTKLTSLPQSNSEGIFSDSATAEMVVGDMVVSPDGRKFRYVKAGGTALVAGKLQQAPAEKTNHQDLTAPIAAVGATSITVTLGATAATANEYAGGFMVVSVTPGVGKSYLISGHPAADSATSLTLTLSDPIDVALTATSRLDLVHNPYNGVIVNPTTITSAPVGVAVNAITADQFGWIQTGGVANVLADGTVTVGTDVVASDNAIGAVEITADGTPEILSVVGTAMSGIATGNYGPILMRLD